MVNISNNLGISNFSFPINYKKKFVNNIGITIEVASKIIISVDRSS